MCGLVSSAFLEDLLPRPGTVSGVAGRQVSPGLGEGHKCTVIWVRSSSDRPLA